MKNKDKIINYEKLEKLILDLEAWMEEEELDIEEKQLLLKNVNQRLFSQIQKQKVKDNISDLNFIDLTKNLMNKKD